MPTTKTFALFWKLFKTKWCIIVLSFCSAVLLYHIKFGKERVKARWARAPTDAFLHFSCQLDTAAVFENSTVSNSSAVDITEPSPSNVNLTLESSDNVTKQDNTSVLINGNATDLPEEILSSNDSNKTDESASLKGPECVIKRGWFRRNIHLETGQSYFSSPDCALEVCNEKGEIDLYSCNRLDAWEILRPTIDREVNEGQLQCLKIGCI